MATPSITSLKDWVTQLQNIWPVPRKLLEEPRDAYKKQADKAEELYLI